MQADVAQDEKPTDDVLPSPTPEQLTDGAVRLLAEVDEDLCGQWLGGPRHAAMDVSIGSSGSFGQRLAGRDGYTSVSHIFVMEWAAVIRAVVVGLLIAGAIGAWVPDTSVDAP